MSVARTVASVLLFVALAAGGVGLAYLGYKAFLDDQEEPSAPAEVTTVAPPPATTAAEPVEREEAWPVFGGDLRRTGAADGADLRPPFRRLWTVQGGSLLEFPPVAAYNRVYFGTNSGLFFAVDALTGEPAWQKDFGRCIASSPAVADDVVYVSLMDPSPCAQHDEEAPGYLVALDADTGKRLWRFKAGVNESSPLVANGIVYFGTWDGKVYALDAERHKPVWTYQTGDKVKGGVAFAKGTVYAGSYDGKLYALDARTGSLRWEAAAPGGGDFYATPVVAGGRVFAGSTDRNVYAFDAKTGDLLWTYTTGNYVYGSAAVWKKTVYVGSYDGLFYALDARTGEKVWSFEADGEISGSPTVLAGIVYFSTLAGTSYGLNAGSGVEEWIFGDGKYAAIVADRERVYVTGYARVYGFEAKTAEDAAGG